MRPACALLLIVYLALPVRLDLVPAIANARVAQGASPDGDHGAMPPTEIDLVKWGLTQGGLTLLLIVVLASYRRDFFRKIDALVDEKRAFTAVLDKNSDAMQQMAVATNVNTKATELLAQNVNNLAERRRAER